MSLRVVSLAPAPVNCKPLCELIGAVVRRDDRLEAFVVAVVHKGEKLFADPLRDVFRAEIVQNEARRVPRCLHRFRSRVRLVALPDVFEKIGNGTEKNLLPAMRFLVRDDRCKLRLARASRPVDEKADVMPVACCRRPLCGRDGFLVFRCRQVVAPPVARVGFRNSRALEKIRDALLLVLELFPLTEGDGRVVCPVRRRGDELDDADVRAGVLAFRPVAPTAKVLRILNPQNVLPVFLRFLRFQIVLPTEMSDVRLPIAYLL